MKRIGTVAVLLALAGVAMGAQSSNFDAEPVGVWDPPTANEPDWTWSTGDGELRISDTYAHSGPNSMTQIRTDNAPRPTWNVTVDATNPIISFWFYTTDNSIGDSWYLYDQPNHGGNLAYLVWLDRTAQSETGNVQLEVYKVSMDTIADNLGTGQWFNVVLENDFTAHEVTCTLKDAGGNVVGTPATAAFSSSISSIESIYSYHSTTGSPVTWVDDFLVIPEPATVGLLALGAVGLLRRRRA